jgi:hypothetical protein
MKIAIDASIFTKEAGSFGKLSGPLELPCEPQIGDTISFIFPKNKAVLPLPGIAGQYRIEDRILGVYEGAEVIVMLEDITVDSIAQARALSDYLERGFDLVVTIFN